MLRLLPDLSFEQTGGSTLKQFLRAGAAEPRVGLSSINALLGAMIAEDQPARKA